MAILQTAGCEGCNRLPAHDSACEGCFSEVVTSDLTYLVEDRIVTRADELCMTERLKQSTHKQNLAEFLRLLGVGTKDLVISSSWLNGESQHLMSLTIRC